MVCTFWQPKQVKTLENLPGEDRSSRAEDWRGRIIIPVALVILYPTQ